ncbi:MAG TPA: O-antigen ligase family protein [Anaeromyxobacteraceae bacterium]|jgi:hypothetical protein|nr:O-antigen ligase family protein [Anaeromyxobacteraceae bacterium]
MNAATLSEPGPGSGQRGPLLSSCVAVLAILLFSTGIDNYGFDVWGAPPPLYWVLAVIAAAGASSIISMRSPSAMLRSPVLLWFAGYFLVSTLWGVAMRSAPKVQQALYDRYRSVALAVALLIIFSDARARRSGVLAVAVATAVNALLNLSESLGVIDFAAMDGDVTGRVPGRAAGFFINSNVAGIAIVLGLAVAVPRIPRAARVALLLLGAAGVAATFSRGAQLCFLCLLLWLALRKVVPMWPLAMSGAAVALFIAYEGSSLFEFFERRGVLNDNTLGRLRLEADDSGRTELAHMAWRMFLDSPLIGKGLASTIDWGASVSSHNQYLGLAAEHGIVGLLLLPALGLALCWNNPSAVPLALVLMLAGLISHNLLEDRGTLLAISLASGFYGSPLEERPAEAMEEEEPAALAR